MTTKITKIETKLKAFKLPELIEECARCASTIAESTLELGGALSEISRRYGADGVQVAIEELGLSQSLARRLVACYRGVLHPSIALGSVSHVSKLEKLTLEEQTDIIENGVPYLEKVGKTKVHKIKRVPLEKLSAKQCAQVFNGDKIRGEDEQFQLLKEQAATPAKAKPATTGKKPAYEVKDGKLVIHKPHTFTLRDLLAITAQM